MNRNQENELLSSDVDELIKIFKDKESNEKFSDISYWHEKNSYVFSLKSEREIKNYIVFEKNVVVNLKAIDKISFNIRTNLQLLNFIKQSEFDLERITICDEENTNLKDQINIINIYVENFSLNLQIIQLDIPDFKFERDCLEMEKDYAPNVYSKYFELYFPSIGKGNDNLFTFVNNPIRDEIIKNIICLDDSKTFKKYKITGPFSSGKSMTLFKFSKSCFNIIYINLKSIKQYSKNYYKFLEILFAESSRVILTDAKEEEFKKKVKLIPIEKGNLEILIQVLKLFLELNGNESITLILDQFKRSNFDYDLSFKEKINELNEQTNLKIVYCSSIDDNEIRDELMPTFIKFRGYTIGLSEETQEYYFYYSELYTSPKSNDLNYLLFNNKIKYIDFTDKNVFKECLKKVDEKILNNLKKFKIYQNSIFNDFNLIEILIFLKEVLNIDNDYSNTHLLNLVSICPLEYFIIDTDNEKQAFRIKPIFPYIKFFISEYIKRQENIEYLEKEKYKNFSFLSNKVKNEYFEYAAKIALKKSLVSKYKIHKEIYVDKIAEMNIITTPLDYFLLTMKKQIKQDNQEEEEIIDGEIEGLNSGEKLKINLDEPINEEEIKEKIKENYKNELKDFNIFERKDIIEREKEELLKNLDSFGLGERYIKYINNVLFKGIDIYRIEEFEERVNKRYEEIENYINKAKIKNRENRIIEIPIKKQSQIDNENIITDKYNGNENILIDQINTDGVIDYAFLFGEKNEKKLLLFQIKCYSSETNLNQIFIDKTYIKQALSSMLINSIKLFNCKIKEWHFILVFYNNDKDDTTNNIGLKTIFSGINSDIEFLLFNPFENKFYMRGNNFNIIEKNNLNFITNESNLDQFSLMKYINIMNIEKFNNNIFSNNFEKEYLEALTKFLLELKKLNINFDYLEKQFNVKNLIYFCHFKIENEIYSPRQNFIFLYKKADSNNFIAVKNSFNTIICYDLEKKVNIPEFLDLIDFKYKIVYVLSFGEKATKKRTFNETGNKPELLFFRRDPIPKLK